jgi:hypothetical protein
MVGEQEMLAVVRTGPLVDMTLDLGGMPPWLLSGKAARLRAADPAFMEAVARFFGALMEQVRPHQAASGGPVVMMQPEHEWFCGDPEGGPAYLFELDRYLRENGAETPLINTNNLFQRIEGQIDGWEGFDDLHTALRQLRSIRGDAPLIVSSMLLTRPDIWGEERAAPIDGSAAIYRLAQCLSAGGQFLIDTFHGGTNFGFLAGRAPFRRNAFFTTSHDAGAPLAEGGGRRPLYDAVARICTFASSFERVFSGLDSTHRPITATPGGGAASVVHCRGAQGSVAFVFAESDTPRKKRDAVVRLTLEDGSPLEVDLRGQPVVWCLFDALLGGRATLDFCNVCAFASVGKAFVCYGPSGAVASLSISGSTMETEIPGGKRPLIEEHEGVTVVICNEAQIDAAIATKEGVWIGVESIDEAGEPAAHAGFGRMIFVGADGSVTERRAGGAKGGSTRAPSIGTWEVAVESEYVDGSSERFATINGPATLASLGAPEGYAWIRLTMQSGAARKPKALLAQAGDRASLFVNEQPLGVAGVGPGAERGAVTLPLKRGGNTISILLENMGGHGAGGPVPEPKGLYGPIWEVKPVPKVKMALEPGAPLEPLLTIRSPLWGVHRDDVTDSQRATWTINHRRRAPLIFSLREMEPALDLRGVLLLNDEPIEWIEPGGVDTFVLDAERLVRGNNVIQLAVLGDVEELARGISSGVTIYEGVADLTEKADWAFAKWERPDAPRFEAIPKTTMSRASGGAPTWWRCSFTPKDLSIPLLFDTAGLTKGHAFVNGKDLGRYFTATHDGKKVGPQTRLYLPEPWLVLGEENELLVFDEHGAAPNKCRLAYDEHGPMGQ